MDVRYINPFITAIENIFDTMIGIPLLMGKPAVKSGREPAFEISSIIGLTGDVKGCVVINLSESTAIRLASALLGDELSELNEDCTDAIGEIANMIAGNAKTDFPSGNTSISVPSVVTGKHKVTYPSGLPIITIPCETDEGKLLVDIALENKG